ncbi:hypothetical protein [Aegicerativicinus sediminis]|uniref:hypothetical protein n=1 Tax=Aegicerativicinus sediminis TaxID=2893202 RepID=UPI001E53853E|nr:hypothetical protein [Aegicerativicinus sediminis]
MILNTTYFNPNEKEIVQELVGNCYSFFKRISLGGIGSGRMIVEEVSAGLSPYINSNSDLTYANVELRPGGIIVRINKGLKNYSWIIPFYQLSIFKSGRISLHGQGHFISFRTNNMTKGNMPFFKKILEEKLKYESSHRLLDPNRG